MRNELGSTYLGVDIHKVTIAAAVAEAGKRGQVREHGKVANATTVMQALAVKLARGGKAFQFCYEAAPCGYGLQRDLTASLIKLPELPLSGPDQSRTAVPAGEPG